VRDGRDMAFSKNTSPLKKYGGALKPSLDATFEKALGVIGNNTPSKKGSKSEVLESEKQIAVWAHENQAVAAWGSMNLSRYRWVRMEDFNEMTEMKLSDGFDNQEEDAERTTMPSFYHALQELIQIRQGRSSASMATSLRRDQDKLFSQFNDVINELKAKPMGSHDTSAAGRSAVSSSLSSKYGKWHSLATEEEIKKLEAIGGDVLKMFGYLSGGKLAAGYA
jgi:hypothetical protein